MEHVSALSRRLRDGCFRLDSLLPPNDLGYHFQPWDVRKKAGGSGWMSVKHSSLISRETLAPVRPFEDLVGQRDTTHQAQRGGKFILPWIPNPHLPGDPEHYIPNGAGSQRQQWRCELNQFPQSSHYATQGPFQQVVLRLLCTP